MKNAIKKITGKTKNTSVRVNPILEAELKEMGLTTQSLLDAAYLRVFNMKINRDEIKEIKKIK